MARRLSKKRNALLVFEFLAKEASRRLVAGDDAGSERALDVLRRAFASGTELHREYRLANALLVTSVSSPAVASRILTEARAASCRLDHAALDAEKTRLISEVEKHVDPAGTLYEAQLPDYRLRSTIGTLLSDWRGECDDVARLAAYEDRVVEHLVSPRDACVEASSEADGMSVGERRALMSIMSRKLEERWGKALTRDQRSLLRDYALAKEPSQLLPRLERIREDALRCLDECAAGAEAGYFAKRLSESREAVAARAIDRVDDEAVGLGLLCLKLIAEATETQEAS